MKKKNTGSQEDNLLSLSYGNIVRRDIATADGLLPESFDSYHVINPGDTVLRLTDLQNDQRSLRVGLVEEVGIITSAYVTLRPTKAIHPKFLNYFLKNMDFRKDFYALGAGVRQSLKFDELRSVKVPVPSLAQQKAIADYLDGETTRIDALIEKKLRLVDALNLRTEQKILELLVGSSDPEAWKLVAHPTTRLTSLPSDWDFVPLKSVVRVDNSGAWGGEPGENDVDLPVSTTAQLSPDGIFQIDGMQIRSFTASEVEKYEVHPGDIIVVKSSGSADNIVSGKCGLVGEKTERFVFSNFLMRIRPNFDRIDPYFLREFLASEVSRDRIRKMVSATTYPNLKVEEYLSAKVPIPPRSAQTQIVEEIMSCRAETTAMTFKLLKSIDLLRERRQSLITSTITGEFEIPKVTS